ncbi:hypothetical protein RFI_12771, partial [Reticulomyxa filosa]
MEAIKFGKFPIKNMNTFQIDKATTKALAYGIFNEIRLSVRYLSLMNCAFFYENSDGSQTKSGKNNNSNSSSSSSSSSNSNSNSNSNNNNNNNSNGNNNSNSNNNNNSNNNSSRPFGNEPVYFAPLNEQDMNRLDLTHTLPLRPSQHALYWPQELRLSVVRILISFIFILFNLLLLLLLLFVFRLLLNEVSSESAEEKKNQSDEIGLEYDDTDTEYDDTQLYIPNANSQIPGGTVLYFKKVTNDDIGQSAHDADFSAKHTRVSILSSDGYLGPAKPIPQSFSDDFFFSSSSEEENDQKKSKESKGKNSSEITTKKEEPTKMIKTLQRPFGEDILYYAPVTSDDIDMHEDETPRHRLRPSTSQVGLMDGNTPFGFQGASQSKSDINNAANSKNRKENEEKHNNDMDFDKIEDDDDDEMMMMMMTVLIWICNCKMKCGLPMNNPFIHFRNCCRKGE